MAPEREREAAGAPGPHLGLVSHVAQRWAPGRARQVELRGECAPKKLHGNGAPDPGPPLLGCTYQREHMGTAGEAAPEQRPRSQQGRQPLSPHSAPGKPAETPGQPCLRLEEGHAL